MFVAYISGGQLRVSRLEQDAHGNVVNYIAGATGAVADGSVSTAGIREGLAVTAHSNGGHTHLMLWGLGADGITPTVKDTKILSNVTDAKVVKLSATRVAVMGKALGGTLALSIHGWQTGAGGAYTWISAAVASASGGSVAKADIVTLTSTRVAGVTQSPTGNLKVIVWELGPGSILAPGGSGGAMSLTRVGERDGVGTVSDVAIAARTESEVLTAVRTSDEKVKLIAWEVLDSGALERRGDVTDDFGDTLDLKYFKSDAYAATFRTASGKLRLVAWKINQDETTRAITFVKLYQRETDGTTDLYSIAVVRTEQPTLVTAVRTQTGVLKLILWQFTDSNLIYILHGNELAIFAHLKEGSVPNSLMAPGTPVTKGQMIGRMGNSGKAKGPHTHFHVLRIWDDLVADIPRLIERVEAGDSDIGEFRPVHFRNVRAMRKSTAVPGWQNNPMTLLTAHGTYFEDYVIWPAIGAAATPPLFDPGTLQSVAANAR